MENTLKDLLNALVIATAFLCGMVYGLFVRLPAPAVRCDGGEGTWIDELENDLTSDRSADA